MPIKAAGTLDPGSKISSLLSLRVKIKVQALAQAGSTPPGKIVLPGSDIKATSDLTQINSEKVFLYFTQKPTAVQLNELTAQGVTVYPDSWIPPVANHPTGFILADMPVDKLDVLAAKNYIVNLDTAEETATPQNDQARAAMNVGSVWTGGDTGAGVTVAVLDSGIDTSNPDFPTLNTSNSKDYSNYPTLDDTITNTVTGHGTHVTGSVLGRGVNSATYKGVAPGANLVFLKIGNDTTGSASSNAIVYAIHAAVDTYHANIITMSYGGWSTYHDGSDAKCQAVDYAVSQGTTVFISAGNNSSLEWHCFGTVAANGTTDFMQLLLTGGTGYNTGLAFNLVWYDGIGTHNGLNLKYYDVTQTELTAVTRSAQSESTRGTESQFSYYDYYIGNDYYYLKVQNTSNSSQMYHIYYDPSYNLPGYSKVQFHEPAPSLLYTLTSPAEADGAIAVGAYVTRPSWTNYQGIAGYNYGQTLDIIASFSSCGPRVDGGAPNKPEIVAPGSAIISARDPIYTAGTTYNPAIIDDNGLHQGNSATSHYFVMQGTSMACPLAAGVGALLLSINTTLTPAQVKSILETTATDKGTAGFDTAYGYGLINASAAVNSIITAPTITNSTGASNILDVTARLNGELTTNGGASTTVHICWGSTDGGTTIGSWAHDINLGVKSVGTFYSDISGLTANQITNATIAPMVHPLIGKDHKDRPKIRKG